MKRRLPAALLMLLALSGCSSDGDDRPGAPAISSEQAEALYLQKCAICHGTDGDGRGPRRGSLHVKPPDFRAWAWRNDTSFSRVLSVIREGSPGTDMPAWRTLSDAEVAGLAEYVLGMAARSHEAHGD